MGEIGVGRNIKGLGRNMESEKWDLEEILRQDKNKLQIGIKQGYFTTGKKTIAKRFFLTILHSSIRLKIVFLLIWSSSQKL